METVDFTFGTLIRTGLKFIKGGQWDADLVDWQKDSSDNAYFESMSSPISTDSASTQKNSKMLYYSHFKGKGRDMLATALGGSDDPFDMLPYEILDRVLASGEPPQIDSWQANRWRELGQVYAVRLGKRNFLVAISRGTEEINVQEVRADPYPLFENGRSVRRPARRARLTTCKTKPSLKSLFPATA